MREPRFEQQETPEQLRVKMHKDPGYLPTVAETHRAFPDDLDSMTWDRFWGKDRKEFPPHLRSAFNKPEYDSYKEYFFELWTKEYIEKFAQYLESRIGQERRAEGTKFKILEVGAGDGKLTHLLKKALRPDIAEQVNFVAVDNLDFGIEPHFPVTSMPMEQAVHDFKPDLVISSWMPFDEDWTGEFAKEPSVREYILIGDPEVTGNEKKTWGGYPFDFKKPVHGFQPQEIEELSDLQFCRTDMMGRRHSKTVSFRRIA